MTLATLNSTFRKTFPISHRWMRQSAQSLLVDFSWFKKFCPALPRQLESERVWVHPRFLATPLDVEPHVRRWLQTYLKRGSVFFDAGAYVGWHSVYASRLVGATGTALAFEASPTNAFFLEFHRRKNNLRQLKVVQCAVADRASGELTFHLLNGGDSTSNSIQCGEAYASSQANQRLTSVTVPMTNLDSHAKTHPPDLIKIDVEGAEMLALQGAEEIMSSHRPPIILAAHPSWLPNGETPESLIKFLHRRRYEIFDIDGKKATKLDFTDYLCLPMENAQRERD